MKYWIGAAVIVAFGIGYLLWIDSGCGPLGGAMTWQGKVCFSDL